MTSLGSGEAITRAAELHRRISQSGEVLEREVARWCRGCAPDDTPFASADLWAGFCYLGA